MTTKLSSLIAIGVLGALVGFGAFAITGEAFWIGMGAAIATVAWLALTSSPAEHKYATRNDRRLIFGAAVAAGITAGLALVAATGWGFWIGVGLSAGLLIGTLIYGWR